MLFCKDSHGGKQYSFVWFLLKKSCASLPSGVFLKIMEVIAVMGHGCPILCLLQTEKMKRGPRATASVPSVGLMSPLRSISKRSSSPVTSK